MARSRGLRRSLATLVAVLVVVGIGAWARSLGSGHTTSPDGPSPSATIAYRDLPPQARTVLTKIADGAHFADTRHDGVVFENRERLLPQHQLGYYHEFTVPTPGASDRGARRIVTGAGGERYYTADHYRTFARVTGGP